MKITVNGRLREAVDHSTIADLLEQLDLSARHVAVEVNDEVVPKTSHHQHVLRDGDRLEVVTLVGGG